jgi:homoserine dehydrogenase
MHHYNLCCVGFGNVGRALVRLLETKRSELRERYDIEWRLSGVMSRSLGYIADLDGLNPAELVAGTPRHAPLAPETTFEGWLKAADADVVFEMSSLNPLTGQPASGYLRSALQYGAHAITANKGPIVHAYRALRDLARARGRAFRFEATVMDGAPIFSLFQEALPAVQVRAFRGILNSTTNLILGEMEHGHSLEAAVRRAQQLGIAETDPSADLDGWDAAVKVAALVTVILDTPLHPDEVQRIGIRALDSAEVQAAHAAGTPYKLICTARRGAHGVEASVAPERLQPGDPFALVGGTSSVVHFETDVLPGITITEHNPSPTTTAYGLLADFIAAVRT